MILLIGPTSKSLLVLVNKETIVHKWDKNEGSHVEFPLTHYLRFDLHIRMYNVNNFIEFPKNHLK